MFVTQNTYAGWRACFDFQLCFAFFFVFFLSVGKSDLLLCWLCRCFFVSLPYFGREIYKNMKLVCNLEIFISHCCIIRNEITIWGYFQITFVVGENNNMQAQQMMILTIQIYGHKECIALFFVRVGPKRSPHLENDKMFKSLSLSCWLSVTIRTYKWIIILLCVDW